MQGPSHVGFALAGGVTVSSVMSLLFPHPFNGISGAMLNSLGERWSYPVVASWLHSPVVNLAGSGFDDLAHKLSFYLLLGVCARLPDDLERREDGHIDISRHRGFTHSCLLVFLLILAFLSIGWFLVQSLAARHLILTDFWLKELCVVFLGVLVGFVSHIIADSMTTMRVKMMWPSTQPVGLGLFSNKTAGEYIVLWGYIFVTGMLVALGVFGF